MKIVVEEFNTKGDETWVRREENFENSSDANTAFVNAMAYWNKRGNYNFEFQEGKYICWIAEKAWVTIELIDSKI